MKLKNWLFLFIFLGISSALFSQEKIVFDVKIKGAKKTKVSFLKKILSVKKNDVLDSFTLLDDSDIYSAIKAWCNHGDKTLSYISKSLINRNLPKISIERNPFDQQRINNLKNRVKEAYGLNDIEVNHLVFNSDIVNNAYNASEDKINIKCRTIRVWIR